MTPLAAPAMETTIAAPVRAAAHLVAAGDVEAALELLSPLVADDSALPPRLVLAMAAWRLGRLDWAIALLRECHARWPMEGAVAEALASLQAQSGNFADSLYLAKLGTALGGAGPLAELIPPEFPPLEWALVNIEEWPLLNRAKQRLAAGELDEALNAAAQHVALNPGDQEGTAFYAATLLRAGQAGKAAETLATFATDAEPSAPHASLQARVLAAIGDGAGARRWHDLACALAPDDAAIAAAPIADAIWLEPELRQIAAAGAQWVRRFCRTSQRRSINPPADKLVIAYLVSALPDPRDAAAVAAVACAHDRARVTVLGYGIGAQSWLENAPFAGAFDHWRDIAALDAATLARFFARDGVHVVIDPCGLHAPTSVMTLAGLDGAVRVAWFGAAACLGAPVYDAAVAIWANGTGYPVCRPPARIERETHDVVRYGADVVLAQLDSATVGSWSAVLRAMPEARLLLRAGDTSRIAVDAMVARFGRDLAARIDLVTAERCEEFYARVDVALTPRRGQSLRMAAEAVACEVPPVAWAGPDAVAPYGSFLRALGFGAALIAADDVEYVEIAIALGRSAAKRARVAELAAAVDAGPMRLAGTIETHALKTLRPRMTA
ncbi:MAG TPA: hypothetical protein VMU87_06525 [Stellaceae bacterium]|nr:hypothetical protein [Stellaceae bacterium]